MKVFKFGGASVKNADAVKNVAHILRSYPNEKICVTVSAMGKTTNALEKVVDAYFFKRNDPFTLLNEIRQFHVDILNNLFDATNDPIYDEINNLFVEIEWAIEDEPTGSYEFEYDQIVSIGELLSTKIVAAYLTQQKIQNTWIDVRDVIKTDNTYREGNVDWETTLEAISDVLLSNLENETSNICITQGFIGVTSENFTTTLGREGSDYSAAIFAYGLNASEMIIWKDVPGVLNADPKYFEKTALLSHISYKEAIELAYYGASVIHPKTIKPLQNKGIPLRVKSFLNPNETGTLIDSVSEEDSLIPSFIFKMNQVLVSISPKDFSFIVEENLTDIFSLFNKHRVKVNVMQNSAINFSVSVDNNQAILPDLIQDLKEKYSVLSNDELELVTIRHYDSNTIDRVIKNKKIFLEQRSRSTVRFVLK